MTEPVKYIFNDRIEWRFNGKLHREDGPAVEWTNGDKEWYHHGKFHREDGPAIELANGEKWWYINDISYTEEKWFKEVVKRWSKS